MSEEKTCSNCGFDAPLDYPTETRCKSCVENNLCPKKGCDWTMDEIQQNYTKHKHCVCCKLVCCVLCRGCNTRDCDCEPSTKCPCRVRSS